MRRLVFTLSLLTSGCGYLLPSCATTPPCPAGQVQCSQESCADLQADAKNCGACFNVCAAGLVCRGIADGGAACACPAEGAALVNGQCLDLQSDPDNCGAPGTVCSRGEVCLSGSCGCPSGPLGTLTLCGSGATEACVNLQVDALHCGSCATTCDPSTECIGGKCLCGDGSAPPCSGTDGGTDGGAGAGTDGGLDAGAADAGVPDGGANA